MAEQNFINVLSVLNDIDNKRIQDKNYQEFINSSSTDLKEQVINYYKSQNITVSNEDIDLAIKAQLENRFKFNTPSNNFKSNLFNFYINRNLYLKKSLIYFFAPLFVIFSGFEVTNLYSNYSLNNNIETFIASKDDLSLKIDKLIKRQSEINTESKNIIKYLENNNVNLLSNNLISQVNNNLDTINSSIDNIKLNKSFVDNINNKIHSTSELNFAKSEFKNINDKFLLTESNINQLYTKILFYKSVMIDYKSFANMIYFFKNKSYDETTLNTLTNLVNDINNDFMSNNFSSVSSKIEFFNNLMNYADAEIVFKINPKNSGIVRTSIDDSSVNYYYLIVTPYDSSNSIRSVYVKNFENNKLEWSKHIGIQVSEQVYNMIKNEKITTKVISKDMLAIKPKGSFDVIAKDYNINNHFINLE